MAMDYRYNYGLGELHDDWIKLRRTSKFMTGSQFKPGMKLCQHFCDNFWQIENTKGQSFAKAWQDSQIMDRVRTWGLGSMSQLWLSWIRRAVFMAAGLPNSSFYRPHFSRQIAMMTGKTHGVLFDPCAGWGGRMLGTASLDWDYYSCEPNPDTWRNLQRMINFIQPSSVVNIECQPVEQFDITSIGPVDVVLTSPPYFNLEIYNHDPQQSYNRHSTYRDWQQHWLTPLINRCLDVVKSDGISAWNVMNFAKNDLVGDVISAHASRGWVLVDTVGFRSPLANIRTLKNRDVTYLFRHNTYVPQQSIL
jgi:hypothetical protein